MDESRDGLTFRVLILGTPLLTCIYLLILFFTSQLLYSPNIIGSFLLSIYTNGHFGFLLSYRGA